MRFLLRWAVFSLLFLNGVAAQAASFDAEIAAFEAADAANPPPANVIPFVGSSSINGWPNLPGAFPNHPVLNRGFGGSQMSDVLYYFDRVVTAYRPPLVVVYEGDNDLAAGKSVSQVFNDYSNFVWLVQERLPATDIAFISVKPSPSRTNILARMAELNGLIAGMADGRRVRYIDVFNPMLDENGQPRPELFGPDMLHMNAAGYALWNSIVGPELDAWASTVGGTFLFDFGAAASTTERAPAPDDPLRTWNNITEAIGTSSTGRLERVLTAERSQTAINLVMLSRFNSANGNGVAESPLFPGEATRDSLFGNTETFNGQSNIYPAFKLTGLDTQSVYRFTFFASRTNATDNRETLYTVAGAEPSTAVLDAANNVTNFAVVEGVTPNEAGEIAIHLNPTTSNNSASHFTYLGVMKVEAVPPQRPISFLREPVSARVPVGQRATFSVAVAGSPPFFIQWRSNGVAIPGASELSYEIPSVTFAMSGAAFSVSVSNLAYSVTSSNAVLEVIDAPPPVELSAQALLFDFGAASTTGHGPSPDDPTNYWNNVTTAVGTSSTASMTNLVTIENSSSAVGLAMLSRFNGANENGTVSPAPFPTDATRDSLFGNTELFSGLTNVYPRFKLTGLAAGRSYQLTFYASRTGVGDNRETLYTVTGAATNAAVLNAANNVSNMVAVTGVRPTRDGELIIALTPGPNNNNANHFTYLGVLKLELLPLPRLLPPRVSASSVTLQWGGGGILEWSPAVEGPWSPISPQPDGAYSEATTSGTNRFFRLRVP
jgi:lysophospholipase L1-like esterase